MRVLITGANGFFGLHVVNKALSATDWKVRCFIRSGKNSDKIAKLQQQYPGRIEIYRGSLLNDQDCRESLVDIDLVYHLAAATGGAAAEMYLNSSVATDHLLRAIVAACRKISVVFCSSFSVYGTADLGRNVMIDESTPLEKNPLKRDVYAQTKLHQENVVKKYFDEFNLPIAVLRPGVIYGPGSAGISGRVGLNLFGLFLHLGGKNILPLTYVENCAEAFIVVSKKADYKFDIYNVVDEELITSKQFLKMYKNNVKRLRVVPINYLLLRLISRMCEKYHNYSKGQLPNIFTPYKTRSIWVGRRYNSKKLSSIGWSQSIKTIEGLKRYFSYARSFE